MLMMSNRRVSARLLLVIVAAGAAVKAHGMWLAARAKLAPAGAAPPDPSALAE